MIRRVVIQTKVSSIAAPPDRRAIAAADPAGKILKREIVIPVDLVVR